MKKHLPLRIAADLANGSKHLVLTNGREGAQTAERKMTFQVGTMRTVHEHRIELRDGTITTANAVADDVIAAWKTLLAGYGPVWAGVPIL